MIEIRQAQATEADWLQAGFTQTIGAYKPDGYFAEVCRLQEQGDVVLLVAAQASDYIGHLKIVWQPDYPNYRHNNIPEVQDLNIRADYRRQGIASRLMDTAEKRILERSNVVGIGFGLYADYGMAQQMYIKRGYVPDGHGIYYKDQPVKPGSMVRADDDLVLYLVKRF